LTAVVVVTGAVVVVVALAVVEVVALAVVEVVVGAAVVVVTLPVVAVVAGTAPVVVVDSDDEAGLTVPPDLAVSFSQAPRMATAATTKTARRFTAETSKVDTAPRSPTAAGTHLQVPYRRT
jgi:hypothetical protein